MIGAEYAGFGPSTVLRQIGFRPRQNLSNLVQGFHDNPIIPFIQPESNSSVQARGYERLVCHLALTSHRWYNPRADPYSA